MITNEENNKLEDSIEDYEYKFVVFIRRKSDDYYEMVINYPTGKCYSNTTFYCESVFNINDYICEENQGYNYPSQLFFYFKKENLDMVEKVFHDITGRKFSDLRSRYSKKRPTLETIFTNMVAENIRLDCDVYKKTYEFD